MRISLPEPPLISSFPLSPLSRSSPFRPLKKETGDRRQETGGKLHGDSHPK
ncbi:hypothetical protein [Okeania sp. SIO1F9]|uniref:hypothetical protein n=1 Tax=Okeania sp. SIO1F9 TaxID=2607813 RepID=UPI00257DC427|nr:hypothetical protein [Okeania sp. SIO1F9]